MEDGGSSSSSSSVNSNFERSDVVSEHEVSSRPIQFPLEPAALEPAPTFKAHTLYVPGGKDILATLLSFCRRFDLTACILSAFGVVSFARFLHDDYSSTYEGEYHIITLNGCLYPTSETPEHGGNCVLSISMAGPNNIVVSGSKADILMAASTNLIVLGSSIPFPPAVEYSSDESSAASDAFEASDESQGGSDAFESSDESQGDSDFSEVSNGSQGSACASSAAGDK